MKKTLTIIAVIVLAACQPQVTGRLEESINRGVYGYAGPVEPFTTPIAVRYRETFFFRQKVRVSIQSHELELIFTGSVHEKADGLIWHLHLRGMAYDETRFEGEAPFMSVEVVTDPYGVTYESQFNLTGLNQLKTERPDQIDVEKLEEELKGQMRQLTPILPREPLTMGGRFMSSEAVYEYAKANIRQAGASVSRNTLSSTVMGTTLVNGRKHLVVQLKGGFVLAIRQGVRLSCDIKGHQLVDTSNGFMTSGRSEIEITNLSNNRTVDVYTTFETETTP